MELAHVCTLRDGKAASVVEGTRTAAKPLEAMDS